MPIDVELFERETTYISDGLRQSTDSFRNGQYDRVIESLTNVIISAGRLLGRDPEIGRLLRLDRIILVAKGYQLKAYLHRMEAEPEHGRRGKQSAQEMVRIARGNISFDNPYFAEIAGALREWEETAERGDFYTRPRED